MKKKPDRKEFRREYGPRAPQKFAKAMQEYRRDMRKFKKTAGKPTGIGPISDGAKYGRQIAKPTGVGPVRSGEEYGRNLKKPSTVKTDKPAGTGSSTNTRNPKTTPKPAAVKESVKPEASGSGIHGEFRKVGDPGPSVTRSRSSGGGRSGAKRRTEDPRARSVSRNLREAAASRARRERKEAFSMNKAYKLPDKPPANPKEGDMYKRPFGPVMIYKNGRFTRIK